MTPVGHGELTGLVTGEGVGDWWLGVMLVTGGNVGDWWWCWCMTVPAGGRGWCLCLSRTDDILLCPQRTICCVCFVSLRYIVHTMSSVYDMLCMLCPQPTIHCVCYVLSIRYAVYAMSSVCNILYILSACYIPCMLMFNLSLRYTTVCILWLYQIICYYIDRIGAYDAS